MSCVPGVEGRRGRVGAGELIDWSKDTDGALAVDAPSERTFEDEDPELPSEAEWYAVEGVLGICIDAELVGSVSASASAGVGEFAGAAVVFVLGGSAASRDESLAAGDGKGVGAPGVSAMMYVCLFMWWEGGAAKGRGGDEEKRKEWKE